MIELLNSSDVQAINERLEIEYPPITFRDTRAESYEIIFKISLRDALQVYLQRHSRPASEAVRDAGYDENPNPTLMTDIVEEFSTVAYTPMWAWVEQIADRISDTQDGEDLGPFELDDTARKAIASNLAGNVERLVHDYAGYAYKMRDRLDEIPEGQGYLMRVKLNPNTRYSFLSSIGSYSDSAMYISNSEGTITKLVRWNSWVIDSSVNRLSEQEPLQGSRTYTQCKVCRTFNKRGTDMTLIRSIKRNEGMRWRSQKKVCNDCIIQILMAKENIDRGEWVAPNFKGCIAYDGDKNMMIAPIDTFTQMLDLNSAELLAINSEHGRFFRKYEDFFEVTRNWFYELQPIVTGDFNYAFNESVNLYNYTPSIFYTSVRDRTLFPFRHINEQFVSHTTGEDWQTPEWYRKHGPFYGVELECYVKRNRPDYRDLSVVKGNAIRLFHPDGYPNGYEQDGPHQLLIAKHDGSLDSTYGVEYVSQPLSYDYWLNNVPDRFWTYLKDNFHARNVTECGIHVHIGWKSMTVPERWVFLALLTKMQDQESRLLALIAGRPPNRFARYNTLVYEGTENPTFNVAMNGKQTKSDNKYEAINTLHEDTVELRHFQGNTGKNSILSILQFVQSMYDFAEFATRISKPWQYWDIYNDDGEVEVPGTPPPEKIRNWISDINKNAEQVLLGWIIKDISRYDYVYKRIGYPAFKDMVEQIFEAHEDRDTFLNLVDRRMLGMNNPTQQTNAT